MFTDVQNIYSHSATYLNKHIGTAARGDAVLQEHAQKILDASSL